MSIKKLLVVLTLTFSGQVIGTEYAPGKEFTAFQLLKTGLELESSSDKTRGTLSAAIPLNPLHNFKIEVSGDISEDEQAGTFADLDGLEKGTKIKVTYGYTGFSKGSYEAHAKRLYEEEKSLRERVESQQTQYENILQLMDGDSRDDKKRKCESKPECKEALEKIFKNVELAVEELNNFRSEYDSFIKNKQAEVVYPLDLFFSVAANRVDFNVFDTETFESKKSDETGLELGVAAQYYLGQYTRFRTGFNFQRVFKQDGTSSEYCFPVTGGEGLTKCLSGNTSEFERTYSRILYAQVGGYTENNYLKAWDVKLSHDLTTSKTGLLIPMYLYESEKGAVNAGIKFDFIINKGDADDESAVVLFFSSAFDIF
ncbi:MAG: hypothetical protein ABJJ44_16690 [Paraglaciecola sp.]|uniref:hypothetical protein n=1 Tax=Paraglaciecola sp. TaxID=1920173 RepID=UPI003299F932